MRMSLLSCLTLLLVSVSGVAAQQVVDSRELGLIRIGMTASIMGRATSSK